jgi:hypothetical protein
MRAVRASRAIPCEKEHRPRKEEIISEEQMPISYFSEREEGPKPRVNERITEPAWGGIVAAIITRIEDNSFGYRFPLQCPDGRGVSGCNGQLFALAIKSEVPDILWPLNHDEVPCTLAILDFLEFCHRVVAKAIEGDYHSFFGHSHLSFEPEAGQLIFRQDINRIFARNGLVYEIMANGDRSASPSDIERITYDSNVCDW